MARLRRHKFLRKEKQQPDVKVQTFLRTKVRDRGKNGKFIKKEKDVE